MDIFNIAAIAGAAAASTVVAVVWILKSQARPAQDTAPTMSDPERKRFVSCLKNENLPPYFRTQQRACIN